MAKGDNPILSLAHMAERSYNQMLAAIRSQTPGELAAILDAAALRVEYLDDGIRLTLRPGVHADVRSYGTVLKAAAPGIRIIRTLKDEDAQKLWNALTRY